MIFVAIASYRDPELFHTIRSVIDNAYDPMNLSFGICQQDFEENYISFDNSNARFDYYLPHESMGLCWALNKAYKLYRGEQYFMQLDAHMQMPKYWDLQLLEEYQNVMTTTDKPIIFSSYPAHYELNDEGIRVRTPSLTPHRTRIKFLKNSKSCIVEGEAIQHTSGQAVKARYCNGGFMFGHGSFCEKVIYDPQIYFWGTEIATTIRAYTHGFDLYHPGKFNCWHYYGERKYKGTHDPHHWNKIDEMKRGISSGELDRISRERVEKLLLGELDKDDPYGLGPVRSLKDYETYAGVDFKKRKLTKEAQSGIYNDYRFLNKVA